MENIFYHIDVNNAFLSWEALYHLRELNEELDIRTIPSVVGGDKAKRHGIVLAKSPSAKKYGIVTGEPLVQAYRKCPALQVFKPHMTYYRERSAQFMELLNSIAPEVIQYSIDEAFCNMTGTRKIYGDPIAFAHTLKNKVYDQLGFTVNIGISSNRLLAKMASDFEKPNRVHTLFLDEIESKMWPLPAGDLFFVGKKTVSKLKSIGIYTIGDIAKANPALLTAHLKKQGQLIYDYANGIDRAIVSHGHDQAPRQYGHSVTIPFDIVDTADAHHVILELSERVCNRLRADSVAAQVISISIKDNNFVTISHQESLMSATNITEEFYTIACKLFDETWEGNPIRLIGVAALKTSNDSSRQMTLFDTTDYEKQASLDAALDTIKGKYGTDSIKRASFISGNKKSPM